MGSIIGAHLARSGRAVLMLARGERARQIGQSGLHITGLSAFSQPVAVLNDPSRFEGADTLIVATKTHNTDTALAMIRHSAVGMALSIQNGLLKNELLSQFWGEERVLGALADVSGELLPDGSVWFTRNEQLYVGELSGACSIRAQSLAGDLSDAGIHASAVTDIRSLEWSKFAAWTGLMVQSITTHAPTWEYLVEPNSALLVVRLVRDIGKLAVICQVPLSDRAPLPVLSLTQCSEPEAVALVQAVGHRFRSTAPGHLMSSLQDLRAGRRLELQETLGDAMRRAKELNISLPYLECLYPLVKSIEAIGRQLPRQPD
jgi:2-dehydropantoate 2-reductase